MIHLPGKYTGKRLNMRQVLSIQLPTENTKFDNSIHFFDTRNIRHTRQYKTRFRRNLVYIYLIIRY